MVNKSGFYSKSKLLKHLDRLKMWEEEGYTYPILAHFEITSECNNKCPLCSVFLKDKESEHVPTSTIKDVISQMADMKLKALLIGGGEPSCHPDLENIIAFTKEKGIDVAFPTNGYELSDSLVETAVKNCTWVRVSLDASNPKMYKKTHGMGGEAFNQVVNNISRLSRSKKDNKSDITIGVSYLIGEHTLDGIFDAANLCKEAGADYIRFRPFLTWRGQDHLLEKEQKDKVDNQLKRAKSLEDDKFSVSYMLNEEKNNKAKFGECYIHHFLINITRDLKMYPCCFLKDMKSYCLGDLKEKSFKEIWLSEERKNFHKNINYKDCSVPCLAENHVQLLWNLKTNNFGDVKISDLLYNTIEDIPHSNFL